MTMESINPTTGSCLVRYAIWSEAELEHVLARVASATASWQATAFAERAKLLRDVTAELRARNDHYARLITSEMGKPIREARAEVEKCAWGCEFYADQAAAMLQDEIVATDATRSYVTYRPLGTLLAVMPWNFPFWQVFRAAAPALMAGNTVLLKHSSNVPQCALAIEEIFHRAGFPEGVFRTLLISGPQAEALIADPRIHAVTLTGSEAAGRRVAAAAGAALKKSVLELGGSDPFVVLADADLEQAASVGVTARFQNAGQSCIAAKRFILLEPIADEFLRLFKHKAQALKLGDPMQEDTHIGPLARDDLRAQLHEQVRDAISHGARVLVGGDPVSGAGYYYPATILDGVNPDMRAYSEELFGPVAIVLRARDEDEALKLANDTRYGLGATVCTRDAAKGEAFVRRIQSGLGFVNGMVKSDPRLPFGGVKCSGHGRELSVHGIREFVNANTIWVR
jgi:succinate-semialdehyde dehydrogenase/glutarate-semialdehyde dehydrogenase